MTDGDQTRVPQVSKPAVSPISKSAGCRGGEGFAGLETRDTADLEVGGTGLAMKYPGEKAGMRAGVIFNRIVPAQSVFSNTWLRPRKTPYLERGTFRCLFAGISC